MDFLVINNSILNLEKIVYIIQNEANEVRVLLPRARPSLIIQRR